MIWILYDDIFTRYKDLYIPPYKYTFTMYALGTKCFAEFLGSWGAIYLCQSVVANAILTKGKGNGMGFGWISFGYGMGLFFPVLVFWDIPSLFNPAFCIALWVLGNIQWYEAFALSICQICGAFCGSINLWLHWKPHFDKETDSATLLSCFTTSPAIYNLRYNFVCEFMSTTSLVVGVITLVDRLSISVDKAHYYIFGPFFIGIYVIVLLLGLGGPTALSVNPARDMGPRLAHTILPIKHKGSSEWKKYGWLPVLAALSGGAMGGGISLGLRKMNIIRFTP